MLVTVQCMTLTDENFQSEVLECQAPVLVEFWASWCGSLQQTNPIMLELAIAFAGRVKIGRLNVAIAEKIAAHYRIRAVPMLLVFHNGQIIERTIGSISQQHLTNTLNSLLIENPVSRSRVVCL
jgi:thioredoxin 1